jgi:hypothetical protein
MVATDFERRAFGLNDVIRFRSCAWAGPQIWMVFTSISGMDFAMVVWSIFVVDAFLRSSRQSVNTNDLQIFGDLGTNIQRICVVISIFMVDMTTIKPTLKRY